MLPLMDKPAGEAVEGILHSIAIDYPQVESFMSSIIQLYGIVVHYAGNLLSLQDQCK